VAPRSGDNVGGVLSGTSSRSSIVDNGRLPLPIGNRALNAPFAKRLCWRRALKFVCKRQSEGRDLCGASRSVHPDERTMSLMLHAAGVMVTRFKQVSPTETY